MAAESESANEPVSRFQRHLAQWFKGTYDGRVTIEKLYEKGMDIKEKIEEAVPDFWDREDFEDLRDAVGFIESLHDSFARTYHSEHRGEDIYYHMRRLFRRI